MTLFALAGLCAFAISACGGGDSSSSKTDTSASSNTTGTSGATGTTGGSATTGTSGSSGGASAPGGKKSKSKPKQQSSTGTGGGSSQPSTPASGNKNSGTKQGKKKSGKQQSGPPSSFTAQQKELYKEAKIVCATLTLDGLAKEYEVKRTPEAVARVYSATYDVNLRGAVYMGCKAGVSK